MRKRKGFTVKYKSISLTPEQELAICDEQIDYYGKKLYYLTELRHIKEAKKHLEYWTLKAKQLRKI